MKFESRTVRKAINKELLRAFEKSNLPISDIVDEEILEKVKLNEDQFSFTTLRNNYVHSGFDAFTGKYQFALHQRRIMRAMAKRLLLYRLGIDYRKTHLGKVDV